ncbi:MAG: YybH family protein [Gemmatimonadales bacterium]
MVRPILIALAMVPLTGGVARGQSVPAAPAVLVRQVFVAESSFAATMANRDTAAFAAFLAPDAIFFGEKSVMRGKRAVVDGWRGLFAGPSAPFSWRPETVEVLDSGTLAHSSGPVLDPQGRRIGTFNSVWRRERDGTWLVVFDKGCPICNCERGP